MAHRVKQSSDRILLVQLADIGDLVLATPAMAALRAAQPQARIDLLASSTASAIVPEGLVDRVIRIDKGAANASRALLSPSNLRIVFGLRRQRYDTVIFLHHFTLRAGTIKFRLIAKVTGAERLVGLRHAQADFLTHSIPDQGFGAKHQARYWLDLVALLGADSSSRGASVKREPCAKFAEWKQTQIDKPIIVIHAGSGGYSLARRWLPDGFAHVARELRQRLGARIVLVGQAGDAADAVSDKLDFPALNLAGKTTLPQLAQVISQAQLFIGSDSGIMHLAAATGTAVVAIFGPSNHHAWRPWHSANRAIVLRSGVQCSPCSYVGHSIGARDGCPARTCMKLVTAPQVVEAALHLLNGGIAPAEPEIEPAAAPSSQRLRILDVPVDRVTYRDWLRQITNWVSHSAAAKQVCTVNPEFIMIARRDPIFRQILDRADLCVPDGVGLLWASRRLGAPITHRVTGSDGLPLIAEHAARQGWRLFLLGAAPGIAQKAADILRERHPDLHIAGAYSGSPAEREEDAIVARINQSQADILFVAYGAPQQDKWIARNLNRLDVKMAMGVGGSLDFIAGLVPRAPLWMRHRGLEWLYRLARQPWRLRRMLRLPRFALAVLLESKLNQRRPGGS